MVTKFLDQYIFPHNLNCIRSYSNKLPPKLISLLKLIVEGFSNISSTIFNERDGESYLWNRIFVSTFSLLQQR